MKDYDYGIKFLEVSDHMRTPEHFPRMLSYGLCPE